ncbi:MAG: hypothetical protein AAF986_02810 [Pseudomonadota bacterium]
MTSSPPISLGILSWRGHNSLSRTLASYAKENLFSLADETVLFLPEAEDRTVALGEAYGLNVRTAPNNLGILGGFQWMAEILGNRFLLLLEDDCPLIEPHAEVKRQLTIAAKALEDGDVNVMRLRHRQFPGMGPRYTVIDKFHRYFPPDSATQRQKQLAALKRFARPGKAARLAGNVLYEHGEPYSDPYTLPAPRPAPQVLRAQPPEELFSHWIVKRPEGYFRVSAKTMNWSNQSIFVEKTFFLEKIIAYAAQNPSRRLINGFPDIEKELNSSYWRRSGWHVGLLPGLFSHELPEHDLLPDLPFPPKDVPQ